MAAKPKKTQGTALVKWDEEFENMAKASAKNVKAMEGKFISFSGGRMSFAGGDIPDNELRCVIIGWVYHNAYYDPNVRYDPKNPQSPICYAFAETPPEDGEMEPLDNVPDKQCGNCAECPFNEYESAATGRGKACKNTVRLALIAEDDLEDIDSAEVVYASIPPKSLKNWFKYVRDLAEKSKRPHWAVITNLARVPDDESQFRVTFNTEELIEDQDLFGPLKEMHLETQRTIGFPYVVRDSAPAKPAKGKAVPAKKKFAKR